YRRQVNNLRIPAPAVVDDAGMARLAEDFEREYERLFGEGAALRDAGIELVNYGVDAVGLVPEFSAERAESGGEAKPVTERETYCPRRRSMIPTPIYDGTSLAAGTHLDGPVVIEHPGTTIVVLSGQHARIDEYRNTHVFTTGTGSRRS